MLSPKHIAPDEIMNDMDLVVSNHFPSKAVTKVKGNVPLFDKIWHLTTPKSIKPVLPKPILSPFRKTSIIKEAILRETKERFRSLDTKCTFRRRL